MNEQQILRLICDIRLRTLIREGEDISLFNDAATTNDAQSIQQAKEIIQFLDAQQIKHTAEEIQHNYQSVLHKILF